MMLPAAISSALRGETALPLRPAQQVMQIERLGAMHQSRLSFMRSLVRRIMRERWDISLAKFELDADGYGTVVYHVKTANRLYSFVLFSNYLAPEDRNDRVIASKWDLTMALVDGEVDDGYLAQLAENVPKQEAGRVDARVFVLSRANRSARNFDYIIDALARGEQPSVEKISQVGYLYRTTAVYGSGKLGMADWEKVSTHFKDFDRPFSAEMFVCLMLRNFSLLQVEHIAKHASKKDSYQPMDIAIKRFIGIGNSTGLGMAPYLINHPQLINRWVEMRELALARIRVLGEVNSAAIVQLKELLDRAKLYTQQTVTEDQQQTENNQAMQQDLEQLQQYCEGGFSRWDEVIAWSEQHCSLQGQEMLVSILLELHPALVEDLENYLVVDEVMDIDPLMPIPELISIIENRYHWALEFDFSDADSRAYFWYRSEEKMEPRLGRTNQEPGAEKQMPLGVAYNVRQCYDLLQEYKQQHPLHSCAHFVQLHPQLRGIIRRVQSMNNGLYGDIHANLLDKGVLPMHLLRCKLAFFGVGKFDPKSKLWVRNTMFQGAPLLEDIGQPFSDDWFLPLAPSVQAEDK